MPSASHTPVHRGPVPPLGPITGQPVSPSQPTNTPIGAVTKTIDHGKVDDDIVVGMIIAAGIGGGFLAIAGQYFHVAAGSVVLVTGAGGVASGLSSISGPQPEQVDKPDEPEKKDDDEKDEDEQEQPSEPAASAQPTPTPPAGPQYIILPALGSDSKSEFESVRSSLSSWYGSAYESFSDDEDNSVLFLTAPLTPQAVGELERNPAVGPVVKDFAIGEIKDLTAEPPFKPEDEAGPSGPPPALARDPLTVAKQPKKIVRQEEYGVPGPHEAKELTILSQEPGKPAISTFVYDAAAGKGIRVYILGTGMNLLSPDIKNAVGAKDFIYMPRTSRTPADSGGASGFAEGTCMASKIFGPKFGVAKKADVTMVKLANRNYIGGTITLSEMLIALGLIKNDITKRRIKRKAVVCLSYTTPIEDREAIEAYKEILVKMMADDIVLVAPTGRSNTQGGSVANNQYPAAFARDTALIAVNVASGKGQRLAWSPGSVDDGVTVAAPGTGRCARQAAPDDEATYYSESVAAATVAGVVAGLMAQAEYQPELRQPGRVAANVKELVQGLAWVRAAGGPPIVWNGVRPYANWVCRRQEDGSCADPSAAPAAKPAAAPPSPPPPPPASKVPLLPPKPTWSNIPSTWKKQFEGDGRFSSNYIATDDTASEGYEGDPLPWCLAKCKDRCRSVFLTRVLQELDDGLSFHTYYICNQYDRPWSNDFLQSTDPSLYDAAIALDKI